MHSINRKSLFSLKQCRQLDLPGCKCHFKVFKQTQKRDNDVRKKAFKTGHQSNLTFQVRTSVSQNCDTNAVLCKVPFDTQAVN